MSSDSPESSTVEAALESVRFVGPATAAVLEREGYDATAITDKRVSFRMLVEAGVNPGVAAKIRREHSLSWSFDSGGDLDRRSAQIRGLGSAEAEWIAASAGDWEADSTGGDHTAVDDSAVDDESDGQADDTWPNEPTPWPTHGESEAVTSAAADSTAADTATTDGSGDAISAEAAWRARSKPTPVEDLAVIDTAAADQLAEAGITSVRSLATADAEHVADVLELSQAVVDEWYQAARDAYE
ncbi:MAG: helix-hairpin-helix domain-containing protein [Euryarchaeota archaeon]|nr:helix-hairpin-helix domain-containing protein [Euryarchaeota archaeon]